MEDKKLETEETVSEQEEPKEEEKVDNYDLGDDYDYEPVDNSETSEETTNKSSNDNELREKIIKMFKIVFIALVIILVLGFIISLFTKKNYSYSDVEDIMKKAAENYFKDNSGKLPKTGDEVVEITADVLVSNKYMKRIDQYIKGETCTGKVSVEKVDSDYNYTPVLSCGDYTTTALVDMVRKTDNIVTEGYGVYYINDEYVYRGKDVKNYVRFEDSDKLWRIVKVDSNNEAVLISDFRTNNSFYWDTRYNNLVKRTNGIGVYHNSSISGVLDRLYNNTLNSDSEYYYSKEKTILTDQEKTNIVEFKSCVGPRSEVDSSKDGSTECAVTETTKLSLLPVYDFLNASIDSNCLSTTDPNCQNYNYLNSSGYWLANGDSEKTDQVYFASTYVYKRRANTKSPIRVVIHLNPNAMVQSGKGTEEEPYIIR